jgi:urease accessory protein
MRRAIAVASEGRWPTDAAAGTVTLGFDDRYRRRLRLMTDAGEAFLLDLAETTLLREGDGLRLDDDGWLRVRAAEEDLVEVRADQPQDLLRFAWHLGNRHLPADLGRDRILIRDDHVIVEMLQRLGARVRQIRAPFNPEPGAYSSRERHHTHAAGDHGHHHDHD